MTVSTTGNRVKWIDTLKFLGIFAIYIGHMGALSGKAYPFVFLYHVQIFFFAAGFFANYKESLNLQILSNPDLAIDGPVFCIRLHKCYIQSDQSGI